MSMSNCEPKIRTYLITWEMNIQTFSPFHGRAVGEELLSFLEGAG